MSRVAIETLLEADCPLVEKMVLLIIARHGRGTDGSGGYPSVRRIARIAGTSRSTVQRTLGVLRSKGWLSWTPGKASESTANTYALHLNAIPVIDFSLYPQSVQPRTGNGYSPVPITDPALYLFEAEPVPAVGTQAKEEANTTQKQEHVAAKKSSQHSPPDPRHSVFLKLFKTSFERMNEVPPPWNEVEGKHLRDFLKSNPAITQDQWRTILDNREHSPVNHAASLSQWIKKALWWLSHPANEFGALVAAKASNDEANYRSGSRVAAGDSTEQGKQYGRSTAQSKQAATAKAAQLFDRWLDESVAKDPDQDSAGTREMDHQ